MYSVPAPTPSSKDMAGAWIPGFHQCKHIPLQNWACVVEVAGCSSVAAKAMCDEPSVRNNVQRRTEYTVCSICCIGALHKVVQWRSFVKISGSRDLSLIIGQATRSLQSAACRASLALMQIGREREKSTELERVTREKKERKTPPTDARVPH